MKKIFFISLFFICFQLVSCQKDSSLDMFGILIQQNDEYCFLIEKEIKNKISQVEDDSLKSKILEFDKLTKDYIYYIEDIINRLLDNVNIDNNKVVTNNKIFSESKSVNELFFEDDKHSLKGKEFLEKISSYRTQTIELTEKNTLKGKIKFTLNTDNPLNREEKEIDWLEYHFKGFPMIAVITKLKIYKRDVLQLENEFIDDLLNKND